MNEDIHLIAKPISREELSSIAAERYGDMVKTVVDIEQNIMAIGGDLHADEEQFLLEHGSKHDNLWGINIYTTFVPESWIEFDSMINLRPRQNNRSRGVDDPILRAKITKIVTALVHPPV